MYGLVRLNNYFKDIFVNRFSHTPHLTLVTLTLHFMSMLFNT